MDEEGRNTEQGAVVELPKEIVTEILLRLPVKSLLRFKTACKPWYSIINCCEFIKEHLNLSHAARYNQHKDFLGLIIPYAYASQPCLLYKEDSDGNLHAKEFDFPYKLLVDTVCNYCDGLICFIISGHEKILIWNASLPTEYKIIPSPLFSRYESTAMGYDCSSDDYKIVKVPSACLIHEDCISVAIFSLKNNSWCSKKISKRNSIYYYTSRFIYAKNAIHWIATQCYKEDEKTYCI